MNFNERTASEADNLIEKFHEETETEKKIFAFEIEFLTTIDGKIRRNYVISNQGKILRPEKCSSSASTQRSPVLNGT